jgi:hypothetical protein
MEWLVIVPWIGRFIQRLLERHMDVSVQPLGVEPYFADFTAHGGFRVRLRLRMRNHRERRTRIGRAFIVFQQRQMRWRWQERSAEAVDELADLELQPVSPEIVKDLDVHGGLNLTPPLPPWSRLVLRLEVVGWRKPIERELTKVRYRAPLVKLGTIEAR